MRFIIGVLLISCLVSLALSVLRSVMAAFLGAARKDSPAPRPQARADSENSIERLVRDPVCGIYIPERTAIHVGPYAFCSEECRRKHGG